MTNIHNNLSEYINKEIEEHLGVVEKIAADQVEKVEKITLAIIDCYKNKGKVVLFGNGGSAADAQHIATELVGKFKMERESLPALALTVNSSILTAIGNDYGFDKIFEKQVDGTVSDRDVVIGISTSGNAENVIRGILKAKEKGAKTIVFTGATGGKLRGVADFLINVPSGSTPRIQEVHIMLGHIICGVIEKELFKEKDA